MNSKSTIEPKKTVVK